MKTIVSVRRRVGVFATCVCCAASASYGISIVNLNDSAVKDGSGKLKVLGTSGSYNNVATNTKEAAFDGDAKTFYDSKPASAQAEYAWCGLEMDTPKYCTKVSYAGRWQYANHMVGCHVQGANNADFSDAETIQVIQPSAGWNGGEEDYRWQHNPCSEFAMLKPWKYFRIIEAPTASGERVNSLIVAEMQFHGVDASVAEGVSTPSVPTSYFAGLMNGMMNIGVSDLTNTWLCEIQKKNLRDRDWVSCGTILVQDAATGWKVFPGEPKHQAQYRVRAWGLGEKVSDWAYTDVIESTIPIAGTWIGSEGANLPGCTGDKAFNGDASDHYETKNKVDDWTGLDFGSVQPVAGIKFVPRNGWGWRADCSVFQFSDTSDFATIKESYTIPQYSSNTYKVYTVKFPQPVSARYARFLDKNSGNGMISEIEFVQTFNKPGGFVVILK